MLRTCLLSTLFIGLSSLLAGDLAAQSDSSQIVFTGCPPYVQGNHCDSLYYSVVAVDLRTGRPVPGMKYFLVSGPGAVNEQTGLWVFHPETVVDPLPYYYDEVVIGARHGHDSTLADGYCRFDVHVEDRPPVVSPHCGSRYVCLPGDTEVVSLRISDSDECDSPRVDSVVMSPEPVGLFEFDTANWVIRFAPERADSGTTFTAGVMVSSGRITYSCTFYFDAFWPKATYSVRIGFRRDVFLGQYQDVPITLEEFDQEKGLGGFDFLIGYDATALAFQLAYEGDLYDSCDWEYFTYRFSPYSNCGDACPSGMLRVIGWAETNNGPYHPNTICQMGNPGWVSNVPVTLAHMRFLVSNDRTLECQFLPIRFYWCDCGDNTLSNHDGRELYLSSFVYDYGETLISDEAEFPTYRGAQDECISDDPYVRKRAVRRVDFYNGGLEIWCGWWIDPMGDINLNGLAYEIADAVMFANYFVQGLSAFGSHVEGSIAVSDVNRDGKTLTITDFVYLTRVVFGDIMPQTGTSPNPAQFTWDQQSGSVSVATIDSLGAVYLIVEGEITPLLLAEQMQMKYGWDSGWTRILIYSMEPGKAITSGPLVSISGATRIVEVQAATFDARAVTAIVSDVTGVDDENNDLPVQFALHANYPNPFNPETTIQYDLPERADVRIAIYNVMGQVVRILVDQSMSAGRHVIEWNGRDDSGRSVSSGVYIYRMTAGDFTVSRKMMLLK